MAMLVIVRRASLAEIMLGGSSNAAAVALYRLSARNICHRPPISNKARSSFHLRAIAITPGPQSLTQSNRRSLGNAGNSVNAEQPLK